MTATAEATPTAAPEPAKRAGGQTRYGALARYLGVRALLIIPTAWILVTLVFFLMRGIGDPITASAGGRLTPAQIAERKAAAGSTARCSHSIGTISPACSAATSVPR